MKGAPITGAPFLLKEVMEGALVEYLMKYGFKREADALLKNI
jgi:hypothetical protein